jgi:DUF4097 and DUF4098 domain-containing protein YvlB
MRNTKLCLIALFGIAMIAMPFAATSVFATPATAEWGKASRGGDDRDSDFPVQKQEKIEKGFDLTAGAHKTLDVDNVTGSIEVIGTDSNQIELVVNKTIRAESQQKLEQAQKEVTLDITQQPDAVKLYVNGPFRCECNDGCGGFRHGEEGYSVKMDFQIRVPRNIDLTLKTVNSGHIQVGDVSGEYSIHNVNGTIDMTDVAGSGVARSVNGHVRITFRENPRENSDFASVNGAIELYFQHNLSGDFRFKTFNGGVYTDFPVTALPVRAVQEQHEGSKLVFRADRYTGGRIGAGGPEIKIETLNGDIRILEKP